MNTVSTLQIALNNAFEIIFRDVLIFVPRIFLAFVTLVVLVWIARIVSKLIGDLLRIAKIDMLLSRIGVTQVFHEIGFQVSIAYAVQVFVKWILLAVAFLSVFSVLGLDRISGFLEFGLFAMLPEIFTLILMLFLTLVVANKVKDLVAHSSYVANHHSPFLVNFVWTAVIIFGTIAALDQLDILQFVTDAASGLLQALGVGIALALGLAFGLGCKEEARCLVRTWTGRECYDLDCGHNTFGCKNCMTDHDFHEGDCDCDSCSIK